MATLNTPKAFDKALIGSQIRKDLEPFIDYINQNFDQIIRAFNNQVTLDENFRGTRLSVSAQNNVPVSIETGSNRPTDIFFSSAVGIRSTSFETVSTSITEVTFIFDEPFPIKTRNVSVSAPFATYEVEGLTGVSILDKVSISGYGAKDNNGTFPVLYRTSNSVTVYNPSAAVETKSSFTGDREEPKQVSLFVLF